MLWTTTAVAGQAHDPEGDTDQCRAHGHRRTAAAALEREAEPGGGLDRWPPLGTGARGLPEGAVAEGPGRPGRQEGPDGEDQDEHQRPADQDDEVDVHARVRFDPPGAPDGEPGGQRDGHRHAQPGSGRGGPGQGKGGRDGPGPAGEAEVAEHGDRRAHGHHLPTDGLEQDDGPGQRGQDGEDHEAGAEHVDGVARRGPVVLGRRDEIWAGNVLRHDAIHATD